MTAVTGTYLFFDSGLPKLNDLTSYQPALASRVFNTEGELIAEYAEEHRILTPLEQMPKRLINAFLASEDALFYTHPGINPVRIISAAIANLRAGHTVQGGSTITQQVAKNLLLSSERSYTRKIKEVILAYRIERNFNKDEILYLYLNHIYLGRGAYGVTSAAWRYFHKHLDELTLAECALLAGLPKAPSRYAPHINPAGSIQRRDTVLGMMSASGFATEDEVEAAKLELLNITPLPETKFVNAYANSVFQQLKAHFGAQTLRRQGLTIIVPYNAFDQNAAIHSLRKGVLEIEQRQFYRGPENHFEPEQWDKILSQWARSRPDNPRLEEELFPALIRKISRNGQMIVNDGIEKWHLPKPKWQWDKAIPRSSRVWKVGDQIWLQGNGKTGVRLTQKPSIEAALYAIDLKHGTVAAEVGGFDYRMGDFDRVTQARRQPGSAFKPFLYAAAMDKDFTPATVLMDTPVAFENQALDNFWRPDNYRNSFAGPVTLRDALEHSRNLASIKLLQDVGISSFLRSLGSYQFKHKFPPQLALALGATEVTLGDLTESYAVIADGGKRWQPVWIQQVQDRDGRTLHRSVAGNRCQICHVDPVLGVGTGMQPAEQTLDPVSSFLATNMMRGVIDRGTGVRAKQLGRPAAGKTGTTNNQVDAWFVGFTPQIITGVWAGRDKPTSMGRRETGSRAALPIWLGTMTAMHKGKRIEDFTPPEGIEWRIIDRKTGKPADKSTIKPFMEAFRSGSGPTKEESGKLNTAPTAGEKSEDFFDLDL